MQSHGLHHARLPCPSVSPRVCSNSCPLSWCCYLTSSSSAAPFFFCLQSFPALGPFPVSSALHIRWPKYWSFSVSISPSNEYSELISFRIDWFDLAVQGILKSLHQHYNLKSSVFQCSAFFILDNYNLKNPEIIIYHFNYWCLHPYRLYFHNTMQLECVTETQGQIRY